jgi:hypothetical protein
VQDGKVTKVPIPEIRIDQWIFTNFQIN